MKHKLLFCGLAGSLLVALWAGSACRAQETVPQEPQREFDRAVSPTEASNAITLFLSGDVMTGRGIDQALPHPGDPTIHEPVVQDAREYVALAEQANGPIQQPVPFAYIWGDALKELERVEPDVRLINLETSVTTSDEPWPGKGIHYRMNPQNVPCLTAAQIDACALANNHVLDWGYAGLAETLETLQEAGIQSPGAGLDLQHAEAPAVIKVGERGRVLVFAYGLPSSGIPHPWMASSDVPGVNMLADLSVGSVRRVRRSVQAAKRAGDVVMVSLHWGGNWGYSIPREQTRFAHALINEAGVDVIHGHSSHHAKGIEVYRGRPVLYGCGDLINDYEGISGYERFRSDLAVMYFVSMDPSAGQLVDLQMTPMQMQQFRLNRASRTDTMWLREVLDREGRTLGTRVELNPDGTLSVRWG